jgi:D-tyrosyl-tRNA(Tyr) deacylase
MICIVQRVSEARVDVGGETVGKIGPGLAVLAAVEAEDVAADAEWVAEKLVTLRIFCNAEKHFDLDVQQAGGSILLVSNFTVAAETRRGRRPSLSNAAPPELGRELFDQLVDCVRKWNVPVETGTFGADMKVHIVNNGPSTFVVRTDPKVHS